MIQEFENLWREMTQVKTPPRYHQGWAPGYNNQSRHGLRKDTQDFIANGAPQGERAMELFKAAADCTNNGMSAADVNTLLSGVGEKIGLDADETARQVQCGIAKAQRDAQHVPMTAMLPQDWAAAFVAQIPRLTLVAYGLDWYQFRPGRGWVEKSEKFITSEVRRFLIDCSKRANNPRERVWVTEYLIRDVVGCVQSLLSVASETNEDDLDVSVFLRLEGDRILTTPAKGWIATYSHHIHVPTVAVALYRGEPIPQEAVRLADSSLFTQGVVPCVFDLNAQCPTWLRFVSQSCETPEMLQQLFGLSLTYLHFPKINQPLINHKS